MKLASIFSLLLLIVSISSGYAQEEASSLSQPKNEQSINKLIQLLKTADDSAKCKILDQIGKQYRNAMPAVNDVTEILGSDSPDEVKIHAAQCLANMAKYMKVGSEKNLQEVSVPVLLDVINSNNDDKLTLESALAIVEIEKGTPQSDHLKLIIPVLSRFLEHKLPEIRLGAAHGLEKAGASAEPAIPMLIKNMKQDPVIIIRGQAAQTLNRTFYQKDEVLRAFCDVIDDDERDTTHKRPSYPAVSDMAALCIYNNHEKSIPLLEPLLDAKKPKIRQKAASSLVSLKAYNQAPKIVAIIGENLTSPPNTQTYESLQLISMLGPEASPVVPKLISLLDSQVVIKELEKHENLHTYSQYSAFALGAIGPKAISATPQLAAMLNEFGSSKPHQSRILYDALKKIQPDHKFPEQTFILEEMVSTLNNKYFNQTFILQEANISKIYHTSKTYSPFKKLTNNPNNLYQASSTTFITGDEKDPPKKIYSSEFILQYRGHEFQMNEKVFNPEGNKLEERNFVLTQLGSDHQLTLVPSELDAAPDLAITQINWSFRKGGYYQETIKFKKLPISTLWQSNNLFYPQN